MEIKTITLPTRQIEVEVYAPASSSEKAPNSQSTTKKSQEFHSTELKFH